MDDIQILQNDLAELTSQKDLWLINFNPIKCEVLTVTRKRLLIIFNYTMHAQILNRVNETKYFGFYITSDLNWNKYINQVTGKANQMLGFVKRNIKTLLQHLKTKVYKALVRP